MAGLLKKEATVETLKAELEVATVAVITDYRGLTVAELTELRQQLFKEGAKFTVVKNTLMKRAIEGTAFEVIGPMLKGPSAIAFGTVDQVKPVKILKDYLKKIKKEKDNVIRGGFMEGKALSVNEVDDLANLPSLDELRAKLLGGIASPMNGLVASLSGPQRALVNVLDQYAKQKAG